jgi:hypothetical protein
MNGAINDVDYLGLDGWRQFFYKAILIFTTCYGDIDQGGPGNPSGPEGPPPQPPPIEVVVPPGSNTVQQVTVTVLVASQCAQQQPTFNLTGTTTFTAGAVVVAGIVLYVLDAPVTVPATAVTALFMYFITEEGESCCPSPGGT